jgi:hypothetical protein
MEYEDADEILQYIVERTIPKNAKAQFFVWQGDFKNTSDGAINGKTTFYFVNLQRISDEHFERLRLNNIERIAQGKNKIVIRTCVMNPKSTWRGKIYLKHYDGMWHIRFEITLSKRALSTRTNKEIGFGTLPDDYLQRVQLADFFEFAEFLWDDFVTDAQKLAERGKNPRHLKYKMLHRILMSQGYGQVASLQYRLARRIADTIGRGRPPAALAPKAFLRPIHLFKQ